MRRASLDGESLAPDLDGSAVGKLPGGSGQIQARSCQGSSLPGSHWASRGDPFASPLGFLEGGGLKTGPEGRGHSVCECARARSPETSGEPGCGVL